MVRKSDFGPFVFQGHFCPISRVRPKSIFRPFSSPFRAGVARNGFVPGPRDCHALVVKQESPRQGKQSIAWPCQGRSRSFKHNIEGVLKRYPEIGDHPNKFLSNPPQSSIESSKRFYPSPQKVLSNSKRFYRTPFSSPKRFYRTTVKGFSEPQKRFCRTFLIEPPLFRLPS